MATIEDTALSLELSRRFEASPERVFDAWLSYEWAAWLPPFGARCEVSQMEPHEGGRFLVRMTMPDGRTVEVNGRYREIRRGERLVLSWSGGCADLETVITVTFRPDGAGTLMTLRQVGFTDTGMRGGFEVGWSGPGGSFDKLARLLTRR
jgi:uncharacterized protein YndB with AHSA1/START domain